MNTILRLEIGETYQIVDLIKALKPYLNSNNGDKFEITPFLDTEFEHLEFVISLKKDQE